MNLAIINCKRFAQSARPGPGEASLLELLVRMVDFVGVVVRSFSWKRFWSSKGKPVMPQEAPLPETISRCLDRVGNYVVHLFRFVGLMLLSVDLCWTPGSIIHGFGLYVDTLF